MSIYSYIEGKNFQKSLAPPLIKISKNEDCTYTTEFHSLFVKLNFDFRFRCFQLPVSEKQPTSGLGSEPEIEKLTMQKLRVKYIHPQSFIEIYRVVSEQKRDQP